MAPADDLKQPYSTTSPSPINLPQPPPPPPTDVAAAAPAGNISAPAIRPSQSYLARVAFLILAALTSASWFLEQFAVAAAAAAGNLRLPMTAAAAAAVIVLLFAALFYGSIHFFRSFFLARPPVATAMLQWKRIGAIAAVGAGFAACLVAAGGFAYRYEYPPARS